MAKKTRSHFRSSSRALALEPRLLFDGAGAVAAMDAVDGFDHNSHQYDDLFAPQDSRNTVDTRPSEMMESPAAEPASLFIIDASVADYQSLFASLPGHAVVRVVETNESGVAAIGAELAKGEFAAVHIISHGTPGSFTLGSDTINNDTLGNYVSALQAWAHNLTADADILLYGCDIAQGKQGEIFIAELAHLTSADIAASINPTGAAGKGGDWVLERQTGTIEAETLALTGYAELLGTPTVESIVRQNPTPEFTNATTVKYLVTFSEGVNGVTADSFVIAPGSVGGATIQLVTEVSNSNGRQYEVTIGNLPTGQVGTLNIDIADTNVIQSKSTTASLNNLIPTGRDDSYTIDTLIGPAAVGSVNEGSVTGTTITTSLATGFVLTGSADAGDTVRLYIDNTPVGQTTADGTGAWSYTYSGANLSEASHNLLVRNSDAAGNSKSNTHTLIIDQTAPAFDASSNVSDIIVEIKFSETLTSGAAPATTDFAVKVNGESPRNSWRPFGLSQAGMAWVASCR